jgi:hypothetical protein
MGPVYILAAALIVALIAIIGIKVARMISREGFETMKNTKGHLRTREASAVFYLPWVHRQETITWSLKSII